MRLVQFVDRDKSRKVAVVSDDGKTLRVLRQVQRTYDVALEASRRKLALSALVQDRAGSETASYDELVDERRLLPPLDHPEPSRCLITGTGLSHLGSAAARDSMHNKLKQDESQLTDSMKMFKWGMEGGKPADGTIGVQPEWFYKGDGDCVVACGEALPSPSFALDGGEEPEIVGLYLIAPDGTPQRLGFAIGNEFSDHVTERKNYLYLAHSKLRPCAIGPELRTGAPPGHMEGVSRIRRADKILWERPFLTGEDNMCHSLANLEYHHFKYPAHRRPGDVHLHFFGTATLSFADGIAAEPGDVFEVDLPDLGAPLVNPLARANTGFTMGGVRAL